MLFGLVSTRLYKEEKYFPMKKRDVGKATPPPAPGEGVGKNISCAAMKGTNPSSRILLLIGD